MKNADYRLCKEIIVRSKELNKDGERVMEMAYIWFE
jgi:hypothetical protein